MQGVTGHCSRVRANNFRLSHLAGFERWRRNRTDAAALSAAVDTLEADSRMIACRLTRCGFTVGLRVGYALIDAFEDLFFGEPGIFQAADLRAGQRALPLQPPVQNHFDGPIGKSDQPQYHGIAADDIELIRLRNLQNLGLGVARVRKVDRRIRAYKGMLAL